MKEMENFKKEYSIWKNEKMKTLKIKSEIEFLKFCKKEQEKIMKKFWEQ